MFLRCWCADLLNKPSACGRTGAFRPEMRVAMYGRHVTDGRTGAFRPERRVAMYGRLVTHQPPLYASVGAQSWRWHSVG